MSNPGTVIWEKMLDRLHASLVQGPCLNCRPHSSRQRVDLGAFQAFRDLDPGQILPRLLGSPGRAVLAARVPAFDAERREEDLDEAGRAARRASEAQTRLLGKLRDMAEDARDYEQETGENALYIGYPLLHVPAGSEVTGHPSPRILAPIGLVPVGLTVQRGARSSVQLAGKGEGIDRIIANFPLLAWLEQQTGRSTNDLFVDDDGSQPWKELNDLAGLFAEALGAARPPEIGPELALESVPRSEALGEVPRVIHAAVLGLFPLKNQGLLRDLKALAGGETPSGTIEAFLRAQPAPGFRPESATDVPRRRSRVFAAERLVTLADPCQTRAVRLAGEAPILVIHGPPGTGKSQTITNLIGDHLARGERVLFVCEKRTAMDVVHHRLAHLGLGGLCAVVHDPQRDQRELYMAVRQELDALPEQKTDAQSGTRLRLCDEELQRIHLELTGYRDALMEPKADGGRSFHDLLGAWLELPADDLPLEPEVLEDAPLGDFATVAPAFGEALDRACEAGLPANPWGEAAGIALGPFLARPAATFRAAVAAWPALADALDATRSDALPPLAEGDLSVQAAARRQLAVRLRGLEGVVDAAFAAAWFAKAPEVLRQVLAEFESLGVHRAAIDTTPLDPELAAGLAQRAPDLEILRARLAALDDYDAASSKWYGFALGGQKAAARQLAEEHGLRLTPETSRRLRAFFEAVRHRRICRDFLVHSAGQPDTGWLVDGELLARWSEGREAFRRLAELQRETPGELKAFVQAGLAANAANATAGLLERSAVRADALRELETALVRSTLVAPDWLAARSAAWRGGAASGSEMRGLGVGLDGLEAVLRHRAARDLVPAAFRPALEVLVGAGAAAAVALPALHRGLLGCELSRRVLESGHLQQADAQRLQRLFARHAELEHGKREVVRDAIRHRWVDVQRRRLLAATGTQLNPAGAALKRRLLTRGERALKLRPMIAQGADHPDGDPLFDMCPVWMASPATVAQIFPRRPVFDVIVFDEASQCRLEEALPVLTRGRRVVIAGDPKQLPPTRFFESAVVETEAEEAETDQELFEQQQGEAEDLLSSALSLDVRQCYLDVHYRSRSSGLIEFSNRSFYDRRLQAIPGHPSNRSKVPPIRLVRVDGTYEKRGNLREADAVVDLVAGLLAEPEPPSIGIACFNLTQRDLILDRLEERAETDGEFARRLEIARARRGAASFEGLFVKNLENVQGDERDHILISTTFGPDAQGRFRRNFGPVGLTGGGRRLNVLVTRARERIHVFTSIPRSEYAALPPLESGQAPGGRWLLYAYLNYVEELERTFADQIRREESPPAVPEVVTADVAHRSPVALGVARRLSEGGGLGSIVPWGNAGFCVDVAVQHPRRAGDVVVGLLLDFNRYDQAEDPVEWEAFRTQVLEAAGWSFQRVLSPGLFSDTDRVVKGIAGGVAAGMGTGTGTETA